MPPRIRSRACKALKENINVTENNPKKNNNTRAPRKALADKTNSASDDTSVEVTNPKKTITNISKAISKQPGKKNAEKKQVKQPKQNVETKQISKPRNDLQEKENSEPINEVRPRRDRRLPTRFVENPVLINLSNSKESINISQTSSIIEVKANTPAESQHKSSSSDPSPFKTPKGDGSLLASRPRRICRLPSRFDDHSISPNKYIPIQPANASTPIQQNKKTFIPSIEKEKVNNKEGTTVGKMLDKSVVPHVRLVRLAKPDLLKKESSDNSSEKSSPDSNNNARGRSTRAKKNMKTQTNVKETSKKKVTTLTKKVQSPVKEALKKKVLSPTKKVQSPITENQLTSNTKQTPTKRILTLKRKTQSPILITSPVKKTSKPSTNTNKNLSFKLLGSKKKSQENDNNDLDVYEFTFDPNEEPQPQKKKRKKVAPKTKKPDKPKKVAYKSSYDQNISKALSALKNVVKEKTTETAKLPQITENVDEVAENIEHERVTNNKEQYPSVNNQNNIALNDTGKNSVHECNYPSIRVEDIAADIEPSVDHHDDFNYSPVTTPRPHNGSMTPNASVNFRATPERSVHNNDPLNLQEELSFFDDQPVASSSMNMSVRHPLASPWRVEFGSLPIKWPVNTYVKPNMTPAVESSFISAEDSIKKKHVYTNMLPINDVPEPATNSYLKQTSIISFIKEMAEKSAKKKRGRSVSPMKAVYEEIIDTNPTKNKTKKNTKTNNKETTPTENTSGELSTNSAETSNDKENSKEEKRNRKRKNHGNICDRPAKSPRNKNNKDCTYFGFDDSEDVDLENVSPTKNNDKHTGRTMRTRSKAVLQEINGPTRAILPLAAKSKIATSADAVNKCYEDLKSAADAPLFPEKNINDNVMTNIEDPTLNDDSQSVHLFEDIEVVHHVKPTRKSYGKAKKVTFRQQSSSDSETQDVVVAHHNDSSDYDDLGDLTFEIPNVKEKKTMKKKRPKKLMSKKEEKEADAWAANFNSMCEDIEEFPLLVE